MDETPQANVFLKPRRAKPFFLRHPWVFSGAIARCEGGPGRGEIVTVRDADGRFVGHGFYNADSQISVRLFSWEDSRAGFGPAFWRDRIAEAVLLRERILRLPERTDAMRLVYSESDGLPGLIVDRYADCLVAQFLSAGMAARREMLLDILQEACSPRGILDRPDPEALRREQLSAERPAIRGHVPDEPVEITTDGLRFRVDLRHGHKSGFYLDQRDNRVAAARLMAGRRVLDVFTYTGAFAVAASKLGGAAPVLGIDSSEPAIQAARAHAELNDCANVAFRAGKASVELRRLKAEGERFDAVILDPPKFARSRPGVRRALRAYRDVNLLAMQLLEPDGILVTCSCSGHVREEEFIAMLNEAANEAGRTVRILERHGQPPDHPVIAACPETAYLQCHLCSVSREGLASMHGPALAPATPPG